ANCIVPVGIALGSDSATDFPTVGGIASFDGSDAGPAAALPGVVFAGGFTGSTSLLAAPPLTAQGPQAAVYIAKVDPVLSKVLWLRGYGDGMAAARADAVAVDPRDGSVLVAGTFMGTLDLQGPNGPLMHSASSVPDVFVAKLLP